LLQKTPVSNYKVAPAHHIQGQDPSPEQAKQCNTESTSFCKICQPVAYVDNLCSSFEWCKAFVLDNKDGCSYLKTGAGNVGPNRGFVTYCHEDCDDEAFTYNFYPNADIRDIGDFKCDDAIPGDPYCRGSGNITDAAAICDASSPCNSFVVTEKTARQPSESFLKSVSGPLATSGHVDVYVKASEDPSDSSGDPEKPGEDHPDDKGPNNVQEGQGSNEAPPSSPVPKKKTISMGVIIGIAVAGAAGLVGLVALLCCCYVKKKRAQKAAQGAKDPRALPAYSVTMDSHLGVQDYQAPDQYGDNFKATARVG